MVVIPPGLDFSALKVQLPPDPLDQLLAQHQQQQLLQLGSSQQFALPPRRSTAGGGGTSTTGAVMGSSGDNSRRNSGGGATAEAEAEASRTLTLAPSGIDAAAPTAAAAVAAESKAESKAAAGGEATAVEVDLDPTASSAAAQEGDGTEMVLVKARNGTCVAWLVRWWGLGTVCAPYGVEGLCVLCVHRVLRFAVKARCGKLHVLVHAVLTSRPLDVHVGLVMVFVGFRGARRIASWDVCRGWGGRKAVRTMHCAAL